MSSSLLDVTMLQWRSVKWKTDMYLYVTFIWRIGQEIQTIKPFLDCNSIKINVIPPLPTKIQNKEKNVKV